MGPNTKKMMGVCWGGSVCVVLASIVDGKLIIRHSFVRPQIRILKVNSKIKIQVNKIILFKKSSK